METETETTTTIDDDDDDDVTYLYHTSVPSIISYHTELRYVALATTTTAVTFGFSSHVSGRLPASSHGREAWRYDRCDR